MEQVEPLWRVFKDFGARFQNFMRTVSEAPPSPGYEPYFVDQGANPLFARILARVLVKHGRRVERERKQVREVINAIRYLGNCRRTGKAFDRRVELLLDACSNTSIIETAFAELKLDEGPFIRALESAAIGDLVARNEVSAIAAKISSSLKVPRGRPVTAASAAHDFFLEGLADAQFPPNAGRGYTYCDSQGDFLDQQTRATRLEFDKPDFDPRPAYRRIRNGRNCGEQ